MRKVVTAKAGKGSLKAKVAEAAEAEAGGVPRRLKTFLTGAVGQSLMVK